MIYKVIFFALIIYTTALCSENEKKLIFVQAIFKHGAIAPTKTYPNDPYKNEWHWPMGLGQLTNNGKKQMYELGQWLRKRYNEFLPDIYNYKDIYIRSTDVDRALMSAETCLDGLYPPIDRDAWSELNWQPIPIHTIPEEKDIMLGRKRRCHRLYSEMERVRNLPQYKTNNELKLLYQYLTKHTGTKINCLNKLKILYETLTAEVSSGLKLPEWAKNQYPSKFLPWIDINLKMKSNTSISKRLRNGLLLNEIFFKFMKKSEGSLEPDRKMWMYSTHGTLLAETLMILNEYYHYPSYASAIIFEMWKQNNDYYITVVYKNETREYPLSIMGRTSCPLKQALNLMEPYMLTELDWKYECSSSPWMTIFLVITLTIIFMLSLILICMLMSHLLQGKSF